MNQNTPVHFITMGNNCSDIVITNLKQISKLHPQSSITIYDWGYRNEEISAFIESNKKTIIIPWPSANKSNYMFQKVVCCEHATHQYPGEPLTIIDSDIIITKPLDVLFDRKDWDVAVTWRPEESGWADQFSVGSWLNAGVLFLNNASEEPRSILFCERWRHLAELQTNHDWFVDQVELTRLCEESDGDLSKGPGESGILQIGEVSLRIITLPYTEFNYFPWMSKKDSSNDPEKARLFHFKNDWRKRFLQLYKQEERVALLEKLNTRRGNNWIAKKILKFRLWLHGINLFL